MSQTNNSNETKWSGSIFCIGCGTLVDHDVPMKDLQEWSVLDTAMCLNCHDRYEELNARRTVAALIKSIAEWD